MSIGLLSELSFVVEIMQLQMEYIGVLLRPMQSTVMTLMIIMITREIVYVGLYANGGEKILCAN